VYSSNQSLIEKGECGGAVTSLLKFMLDTKMVDGVVTVKARNDDRYAGVPVLITESERLIETSGSLHCSTPNIARFVKTYLDGATTTKLAIVGKPCDIRAIIELQKRKQIDANNLILVGLNCTGTLSPVKAREMYVEEFHVAPSEVVKEDIDNGELVIILKDKTRMSMDLKELEEKGYGRRENCRRCDINIPIMADIACGKWGTENSKNPRTFIETCSDTGRTLIQKAAENGSIQIEVPDDKSIQNREKKNQTEIARAKKWLERDLKPLQELNQEERLEYWWNEFNKCVKCYGCRDACPLCYCDNCLLEANREYLEKGRIPPTAIFPLTRLAHVADSCVNCGQCQDVCPMELPLSKLFTILHKKLSKLFAYTPGIDIEQGPPLITITEEEQRLDSPFLDITKI
ncbi:MAG: Coenzyme F420 hydrogenase/dehydrogenase, beta subunit C-terminal domain, partial [Candidatus Thorarchaeota archaeon]